MIAATGEEPAGAAIQTRGTHALAPADSGRQAAHTPGRRMSAGTVLRMMVTSSQIDQRSM